MLLHGYMLVHAIGRTYLRPAYILVFFYFTTLICRFTILAGIL